VWHLPEFMVPSWAESSGGSGILDIRHIGKFVILAMAVAIVITWVFDKHERQRTYGHVDARVYY
jgi:hypothetical protein